MRPLNSRYSYGGNLCFGVKYRSEGETLVGRHTRFLMLVHLPDGHDAVAVRDGLLAGIEALPARPARTLT